MRIPVKPLAGRSAGMVHLLKVFRKYLVPGFLCLFAFPVALTGETGVVTGRIFDRNTLDPLPGATVAWGRGQGTAAGPDGYYEFRSAPGELNLTFRYLGYKPEIRRLLLEAGDTIILNVALDQDVAEIDQIVVSAGKAEQRLSELTVSVNIIRPEVIAASHITDPVELINRTPGIEVVDGQASVRGGSGFSYGAGSRVLALIDGLPILAADAGHIKWQFLPLENISQIEIIKGATSVLYGSSALNGVINFRTSEAGDEPETSFYVESGTFGKPRQRDWIWWNSPRTFHSSSFSHIRKEGTTDLAFAIHLLSDEGYRRLNEDRLGRVNFKVLHRNRNVEGLSYGLNLNGGLTRRTNFLLWEDADNGALRQDESTANRLHGNLFTADPFITFNREGRYSHQLRARFQSAENYYPTASQNNSNTFSVLAEYLFRYHVSDQLVVNLGLMENYSNIWSDFHGDHKSLNLAGYSQADINLFERLKVVAGVRVEHNSINGVSDGLTPLFRTGLNYRLLDYTFLRASFGQGYRYPSIAEKHAATTVGSIRIVPNPSIRSESGWSSEIAVKQGIMRGSLNGQVDLALFHSRYSDMIEYLFGIYPVPGEGTVSYGFMATNVENARVYGSELEFMFTATPGRFRNTLSGGYIFMYPVEYNPLTGRDSDVYLKYRRMHSFKLNFTGSIGRYSGGINLSAGSRFLNIDDVFINEMTRELILPGFYEYWNRMPDWHLVVDPHVAFFISGGLKISLAVRNILNTEYMGRPGDIMPHRSFSLRLSGAF